MVKKIENILIACDKFKGSLSSNEVCNIIGESIKEYFPEKKVQICPMADGGDGTVDALVESLKGEYIDLEVTGPLGDTVKARFGIVYGDTAVIEMASASGLWLVPENKKDPSVTTTFGTGEMIKKALELGCKKIIIGIGGSATNDAGMGMAQALGVDFFDKAGRKIGYGGKNLKSIKKIDPQKSIKQKYKDVEIIIASDVDNPLYGKNGAAYVYAPQKGADIEMVRELDEGLRNFAKIVKKDLNIEIDKVKGAGAAGGLGAGLIIFLGGRLKAGAEIVINMTGIEEKIKESDIVITGEGKLDSQTRFGKSPYAIARLAKKYKKPVITINGSLDLKKEDTGSEFLNYFDANFSIINKPMTVEKALEDAEILLKDCSAEVLKTLFL